MTSESTSPAHPQPEPLHRGWYWSLHGGTCGAIITLAGMLFFANVPGQEILRPDIRENGKYGPHWESCASYYEHGWPLTYLKRERYQSVKVVGTWKLIDRSPWDFAGAGEKVEWSSVVLNGLLAGAAIAVAYITLQLWFGKRRFVWQFRLTDLFLATALVSGCLAWYVWNRQERDRELRLIGELKSIAEQARGHTIASDEMKYEFEVQPGGPTFLRRIVGDGPFQAFDRVIQCDLLDEAPQFAGEFRHLRVFRKFETTADFGKLLSKMKNVEAVDLCFAGLEDTSEYPSLPRLRCINLHSSGSDDCLPWLARCRNLEMIMLTDCYISDKGASYLAKLKRLKVVYLTGEDFSAEGFRLLSTLPQLEVLEVESRDAGDDAIPHLGKMRSLRELALRGMPISDDGLLQLASLHALEALSIDNTSATKDGVTRLQSLLPKCTIYHNQ